MSVVVNEGGAVDSLFKLVRLPDLACAKALQPITDWFQLNIARIFLRAGCNKWLCVFCCRADLQVHYMYNYSREHLVTCMCDCCGAVNRCFIITGQACRSLAPQHIATSHIVELEARSAPVQALEHVPHNRVARRAALPSPKRRLCCGRQPRPARATARTPILDSTAATAASLAPRGHDLARRLARRHVRALLACARAIRP